MNQRVVGVCLRQRIARFAVLTMVGLAAMGSGGWPVQHARAQVGFGCVSKGNGLQMDVEMSWVDGNGYRPVTVRVTTMGAPSATERSFSVRLKTHDRHWGRIPPMSVVEHFVMPAGSNQASVTLTLPAFSIWNEFDVELYEDGVYLDKVSQLNLYYGPASSGPRMPETRYLLATSNAKWPALPIYQVQGASSTAARFPMQQMSLGTSASASLLLPPQAALEQMFPHLWAALQSNLAVVARLDGLPERWQQYLALDVVLISLDDLLLLGQSYPRRLEALLGWVHAGGTLIVGGLHKDYARLSELERTLLLTGRDDHVKDVLARGWIKPDPGRWQPVVSSFDVSQFRTSGSLPSAVGGMNGVGSAPPSGAVSGASAPGLGVPPAPQLPPASGASLAPEFPPGGSVIVPGANSQSDQTPPGPDERPFLLRPYGLGTLIVLGSDEPLYMAAGDWQWLLNSLEFRRLWDARLGLNLAMGNYDFWDFLIPGVGLAPRWTFLFLISVFVVVIGPVNYYWLRRRQRLYLMLVFVPLVAALTTMGLFAYAVLADGLGVRVRVRSLTEIDQRLGRATSWARLSYYAGLAPANGLTFSGDVAILPLEPLKMVVSSIPRERTLEWADGKQYLRRNWLPARVPTQYLTLRTRPAKAGLRILGRKGKGLRVRNELGTNLERLLVCDEQGKFFSATSVAAGTEAMLSPANLSVEAGAWRAALDRYRPQLPDGYGWGGSRLWPPSYIGPLWGTGGTQQSNLLENVILRLFQACDARGVGLLAEPRTYIAIGESSPEVELGLVAQPEASLFLIRGRW